MTTSAAAGGAERVDFTFARRVTEAFGPFTLVLFVWAVTWLPLVVLSAAVGQARGDGVTIPFLSDVAANGRVLVAIPLLLVGIGWAGARLREAQESFVDTGLIEERSRDRFREVLRSSASVVRSPWTDAALLVLAFVTVLLFPLPVLAAANSWQAWGLGADAPLTPAGRWLVVIVLPLYRFLLLRWLVRFIAWAVALARISRFELRLLPTHADRAGGLAFVGRGQKAFAPLVLALSVMLAGDLGNDVLHLGDGVHLMRRPIALFGVIVLAVWVAPLLLFLPVLVPLKRRALLEHDALAARCSRAFESDWLRAQGRDVHTLLAADDVQSLAAIQGVCDIVRRLKLVPIDGLDLLLLALITLAPMLPLVLSTIPPEELGRLLRTIVV